MPRLETWDGDRLTLHWFGQVRTTEIEDLALSVAFAPRYRQLRCVLSDFSECEAVRDTGRSVAGDVEGRNQPESGRQPVRAAIVPGRTDVANLFRTFDRGDRWPLTLRIFADVDEARAWLAMT